eukprot:1368032-Amphidinium_carterae.1
MGRFREEACSHENLVGWTANLPHRALFLSTQLHSAANAKCMDGNSFQQIKVRSVNITTARGSPCLYMSSYLGPTQRLSKELFLAKTMRKVGQPENSNVMRCLGFAPSSYEERMPWMPHIMLDSTQRENCWVMWGLHARAIKSQLAKPIKAGAAMDLAQDKETSILKGLTCGAQWTEVKWLTRYIASQWTPHQGNATDVQREKLTWQRSGANVH